MATLSNNLIIIWDKLKSVFTAVSNEINTRTEQYSSLSSAINSKADATDLNTEITNRQNADNTLQDSIDTLNNSKLTAPAPSAYGNKIPVSNDGSIGWNNIDVATPYSPATTNFVAEYVKQHSSINFLGIIEYANNTSPALTDFAELDLYIDDLFINFLTGDLWRYDGSVWNTETLTTPTNGDFYEVNNFINFDGLPGTLTWLRDVGSITNYWYYKIFSTGGGEVAVDNISIGKSPQEELQIKGFNLLNDGVILTKDNGVITPINVYEDDIIIENAMLKISNTFVNNMDTNIDNKIDTAITDALGDIESVLANINSGGI